MKCYRFRFFDLSGRLAAGRFARFEDDNHARVHADKALFENGYGSVEVLDADRSVYRGEKRWKEPREQTSK
jgi:hypothetical protein